VHSLDALNYLLLGNLEDARVEIRNSYRIQQALYDKHYKELDKAKKDSQGTNWEKSFSSSGDPNYNNMKSKASSVASIYQNAFAYYISSVVYELNNEPDEAYIDLKKAIVAAPDSRAIQNDLQRLSRNLGFTDELQNWQGRYGKADIAPKDYIDIFLVFELGVAPHREEFKLVLPIPSVGLVSVAFPVYVYTPSIVKTGYLSGDSRSTESSIVSDTDAIASRNLLDDYPILVAKQIVRATLKGAATREAGKQGGDWAQLAAGIVFAISEQADLRTWSMLPKQFQVARLFVPKGTTEVTVSAVPNVPGIMSRTVEIPEKASHMIIMARASEKDIVLYTKSF
jgi:hypothetical protein